MRAWPCSTSPGASQAKEILPIQPATLSPSRRHRALVRASTRPAAILALVRSARRGCCFPSPDVCRAFRARFPWPQRAFLRRSVTQDSATSFGSAQALVSESCCRKTHASAPETRLAGRCGTRVDSVCVLRTPSEAPGACAAPMRRCKATAGAGCCLALRHAARRIASSTAPPGCRCRSPDPACASRHWPFRLRLTEARRAGRPHGDGCRQRR